MLREAAPATSTPKKPSIGNAARGFTSTGGSVFDGDEALLKVMSSQRLRQIPQTPSHKHSSEDMSSRFLITPRHVPVVKRHREVEVVYSTQPGAPAVMLNPKRLRTRQRLSSTKMD